MYVCVYVCMCPSGREIFVIPVFSSLTHLPSRTLLPNLCDCCPRVVLRVSPAVLHWPPSIPASSVSVCVTKRSPPDRLFSHFFQPPFTKKTIHQVVVQCPQLADTSNGPGQLEKVSRAHRNGLRCGRRGGQGKLGPERPQAEAAAAKSCLLHQQEAGPFSAPQATGGGGRSGYTAAELPESGQGWPQAEQYLHAAE